MAFEYISSFTNKVFILPDATAPVGSSNVPAIAPVTKLSVRSKRSNTIRRDKTGFRSETTMVGKQREVVEVTMSGYGTGFSDATTSANLLLPFSSALCSDLASLAPLTVTASTANSITFAPDVQLAIGDAVAFNGEIRFISAKLTGNAYQLVAPFKTSPAAGETVSRCASLKPGAKNVSFGLLDSWDPGTAVQRMLSGVQAGTFDIAINNDFLEYTLKGYAIKVEDSVTTSGANATDFNGLRASANTAIAAPIAGYLGQAWIGDGPTRLCTLTQASVQIDNNIALRNDEFGCYEAKSIVLGKRSISIDLGIYQKDDTVTQEVFQKAVNNEPLSIMLQIGSTPGGMFGLYLPAVLFEPPQFDDSKERLIWKFTNGTVPGGSDDDIFLAFA